MVRIKHIGGEKVAAGNYWNISTGERTIMNAEGTLPGNGSATYFRAHPAAILAAGPFLGLLYAAFLPFIGLALVFHTIIAKIFTIGVDELSKVATFNWAPARAYLTGRRQKKSAAKKAEEAAKSEEKKE
ncbi:MAG: hypothetical protein M0024_11910 [Nitrospiraceae bacterium]|nr:hypothetical protein [Nitrospiraceae bacterium]